MLPHASTGASPFPALWPPPHQNKGHNNRMKVRIHAQERGLPLDHPGAWDRSRGPRRLKAAASAFVERPRLARGRPTAARGAARARSAWRAARAAARRALRPPPPPPPPPLAVRGAGGSALTPDRCHPDRAAGTDRRGTILAEIAVGGLVPGAMPVTGACGKAAGAGLLQHCGRRRRCRRFCRRWQRPQRRKAAGGGGATASTVLRGADRPGRRASTRRPGRSLRRNTGSP